MKTRIAVMFGGKSTEHEVSIISALQALHALNPDKYEPVPLYITKDNRLFTGELCADVSNYRDIPALLAKSQQVLAVPSAQGVDLVAYPQKAFGRKVVAGFEVVLPVVHGTNVEDGTLMGMLEMWGVPYAAGDVLSSALGMDKYVMKTVLREAGVPVLDAQLYRGKAYAADPDAVIAAVEAGIGYPVIVKPVNLGSSVGISKASDRDALRESLDTAFSYAPRVLVERAVGNLREINCAVVGDADAARPSACEEPLNAQDILTYQDKYMSGGKGAKSSGMESLARRCPADIPPELEARVKELAVATFQALGCSGVSRIDFLNDKESGEPWVTEIYTIPGSLAFYLFEEEGTPFAALLDEMVSLAFKRQREREALTFSFDTNLLSMHGKGGAKGAKA